MTTAWTALTPQWLAAESIARADPNLRMADASRFAQHLGQQPDPGPTVPVSVQLRDGGTRPDVEGMKVPDAYPATSRCFTARVNMAALNALLGSEAVARVQLSEGLLPQRARGRPATPGALTALPDRVPAVRSGTPLLLGVIDSGCPFAHVDLRTPDGQGTRVVRLWDQDGGLGAPPSGMGYGSELQETDLLALMGKARDASGRIDEHTCYRLTGANALLGRTSHGAHALGLLAGRRLFNARPNRATAAPLRVADDDAADADIAFVQLPHKLLQVPYPPGIEHHLIDGLRYLLDTGKARGAQRIVVSIGYESWLGPHDESGWFGQAVQELITEAGTLPDGSNVLEVHVIAGNSGDDGVHCELADPPQALPGTARQATVHWHLPPGSEAPTQIELWTPDDTGALDDLALEITPPGQPSLPAVQWGAAVAWPDAVAPALCVVMDRTSKTLGTRGHVVVLRLAPTQADGSAGRAAPHGEWSLTLRATQALAGIAVYIGRGTASMNAPLRGRQAVLTRRGPEVKEKDRQGTISAHACHPALQVATASVSRLVPYRGRHASIGAEEVAPYAGVGPTRGVREGPSYAVVVEHGVFHRGHIGIGNRSGTLLRMFGTSTAAPLGARLASRKSPDASQPRPAPQPVPPPAPAPRPRAKLGTFTHDPQD